MIKDDRIELNDRFRKAFQLLEEKGVIVKNDRSGKGVGDVAEHVLGNKAYGHIIRAYLNGNSKRVIDYGQASTFCRVYGINEAWMLNGVGAPFGFETNKDNILPVERFSDSPSGNILFTNISAFAGSSIGDEHREDNTYFSIPGVGGSGLVAFQINGNSMEPILKNNDLVVCRFIENIADLKDNEIYAVKSNGKVWVKYVQKITNARGRVIALKMISANYFDHDPFEEEVNESTALYKVIRKISNI